MPQRNGKGFGALPGIVVLWVSVVMLGIGGLRWGIESMAFLVSFSRGGRGERYLVGPVDAKEKEERGEDNLFLVEQLSYRGRKRPGSGDVGIANREYT